MSKVSSDDSGCVMLIIVIILLFQSCNHGEQLDRLEKKIDAIEARK